MICPKCHGTLRTVDKQGVHLEQCDKCRGIFLDHGELELILQAEQRYYGSGAAPYLASGGGHLGHSDSPRPYRSHSGGHSDSPRPYRGHSDSPRPYRGHSDSPGPYGHHKRGRGSFLGDLFG
ncbi:MAG: zf-TFIIB domain-containing protein [Pseudonocardiaceae bacterium]